MINCNGWNLQQKTKCWRNSSGSICGENGQVTVLIETLLQSEEWFHPEVLSVHSFQILPDPLNTNNTLIFAFSDHPAGTLFNIADALQKCK